MIFTENISLLPYNSFGIQASARYFARFASVKELTECLDHIYQQKQKPALILGGGSNLLLTGNVNGWVIKNELRGMKLESEDETYYYVRCHAGENWHSFVQFCIQHNYAGIENLSLIPGNAGASPMQNIGAYGVEIKDVFHELEAWDMEDKRSCLFSLPDCEFGYRESIFKKSAKGRFVILSVLFRLRKVPVFNTSYGAIEQELAKMGVQDITIRKISEAVIRIRSSKLPNPAIIGNAGSFFKNPVIPKEQFDRLKTGFPSIPGYPVETSGVKVAAGWLIEQCGWKGFRKGDAGCYDKQALVLVNYGKASGAEIYALSESIINSVKEKFGIILEREVNIL